MRLTRRRWLAAGAIIAAFTIFIGSLTLAEALRYSHAPAKITVQATPVTAFDPRDESKTRFGRLEFRGGLVLTSSYQAFGGISGLHMEPDGTRFLALTDQGSWLRGRIIYRDGIADAEMAPMLGPDGKPLAARHWFDAESLAEGNGEPIPVPDDFKSLSFNKSLECLTAPPKDAPLAGALIAITERSLDAAGNHRSYVIKSGQFTRFTVKRSDDFDVSDCTISPPADILLLEHRYSLLRGFAIRIRRLHLADIREGARIDGPALFEADLGYQIDNMEGIGLHRNAQGETILTLISDDNFSIIQRNLLLQFALVGE